MNTKKKKTFLRKMFVSFLVILGLMTVPILAQAVCPAGEVPAFDGSDTCILDPVAIPKYEIPLVIPPVMNNTGMIDTYDIAVREFNQQILPGGIWKTLGVTTSDYPATKVWSYGPAADPIPATAAPDPASQFNYPAYTVETTSAVPVSVKWRNELVAINPATGFPYPEGDANRKFLPHILTNAVDQTLHWANPPQDCRMGPARTDCMGTSEVPYTGPVPIVTHLHGAHVEWDSDGYPESWWLPTASDLPAGYATSGGLFTDATGTNPGTLGYADYLYRNDQPATTLWYHDHSLGMTRLNVYAGPAGFWLVRGGVYDKPKDTLTNMPAVLPAPAPVAGETVLALNTPGSATRGKIREIPIVIQDRSFNGDGSLFYPENRAFFEGVNPKGGTVPTLNIPFVDSANGDSVSDIAPIWNPEAFFTTMVVNGVVWPNLDVAPAKYRFRLLNGCDSRFLNLSMFVVNGDGTLGAEIPFYQIGAEQGYLPNVVQVQTGFATVLPGTGVMPALTPAADPAQALLVALAERADVIVDFSGLANGTKVRMINTGPDAPFNGTFDPVDRADPATTGQVMEFTVSSGLLQATDALTTSVLTLKPKSEPMNNRKVMIYRQISLNEGESELICADMDAAGNIVQVVGSVPPACALGGAPFAPKEALLGTVDLTNPAAPAGIPLHWTDTTGVSTPAAVTLASGTSVNINVTENPIQGDTEIWEIYNFTMDAHPIHLHLVRFAVVDREISTALSPKYTPLAPNLGAIFPPEPWETGFKDTVIAYPGEITRVKATFDIAGLYVWHCHILEHEDNEMMRPYVVSPKTTGMRP